MKQTFVKAALAASCLAVVACKQAPTAMGPGQYAVITVATSDREIPISNTATIQGRQDIAIYPQVSGTISQLCVTEGQKVSKGQTLFIIDQVPYKAALQTAEANVAAAEAGVATAQLTYDSKKELFAKNVVSKFDLLTAENSLLTAKAQLAQAEAQRVNAANNLSYTVVKAPSNGVVGTLPYRVGALVSASIPQPLTTVSDNSTMYVYFSMTAKQMLAEGALEEGLRRFLGAHFLADDDMVEEAHGSQSLQPSTLHLGDAVRDDAEAVLVRQVGKHLFGSVHVVGMARELVYVQSARLFGIKIEALRAEEEVETPLLELFHRDQTILEFFPASAICLMIGAGESFVDAEVVEEEAEGFLLRPLEVQEGTVRIQKQVFVAHGCKIQAMTLTEQGGMQC